MRVFLNEFWLFGIKQAWACLFGAYLLTLIIVTRYWYPFEGLLYRNDFLFLSAVLFQLILLMTGLESYREAFVILVFHVVATLMELFKTSNAVSAWHYPGEFQIRLGNVPLFAGFMYSAVGSYIARVTRIFDFQFSHYPPRWIPPVLVTFIYINFFSHHYVFDIRWILLAVSVLLFGRSWIYFRMDTVHRRMPLILGWLLVALFIWIAENIATYSSVWVYPSQKQGWHLVPLEKLIAWYLLMLLSFVLVTFVHEPKIYAESSQLSME